MKISWCGKSQMQAPFFGNSYRSPVSSPIAQVKQSKSVHNPYIQSNIAIFLFLSFFASLNTDILNHQFIYPVLILRLPNCKKFSAFLESYNLSTSFTLEIAFSTILLQKIISIFDIHPNRDAQIS